MEFVYWLDALIYGRWYRKCIREICKLDPGSELDRQKVREQTLKLIEENGIPMEIKEMEFFTGLEKSVMWGFWYWVKRMEKKLVRKGIMHKDRFFEIAEDAFYPFMLKKIWDWRDSTLASNVLGKRRKK